MVMGDRIKSAAEEAMGKAKKATSKVTGNRDLKARGQAGQATAETEQAGDHAQDAADVILDR
jgi:uncharacterized protein YjbJ (UPF0337 family)